MLFVAIPAAELYVILQVGHAIGALQTVGALIAISFVGAWLCKLQGFTVLGRIQGALNEGPIPLGP